MVMMQKWWQTIASMPHLATATANPLTTYLAARPVPALLAGFTPTQAGSGTPSSSNVRAIIGRTSVSALITGKNLFDLANSEIADKKIRNSSGVETNDSYECYLKTPIPVIPGSTVTISGLPNDTTTKRVYYLTSTQGWLYRDDHSNDKKSFTVTIPDNCCFIQLQLRRTVANWGTVQVEYGSTASAYESFTGTTIEAELGGTYYGGVLDLASGTLTVTWGYIASYAGETLPGRWMSSKDAYASGTTPTTGAQVAYILATPQTVDLTGQTITAPPGWRTVSANTQNMAITHWTN